ncbi:GNAT family N-acetyltransferase [Lacticaseibacillus camelliae]|nr:GNAT family N-acetyltransferase [Lacticaseibacillus camelliae]
MITIRPATDGDMSTVWQIETGEMDETKTPHMMQPDEYDGFKTDLLHHAAVTLVACTDAGQVCGYITCHFAGPYASMRHQWVAGLAVSKMAQGEGIGRALIDAVKAEAAQQAVGKISFRVLASNTAAIGFYQHLGMTQEAHHRREFWLADQWQDEYQYALYVGV